MNVSKITWNVGVLVFCSAQLWIVKGLRSHIEQEGRHFLKTKKNVLGSMKMIYFCSLEKTRWM